jgi:hypothetical protein
MTDNRFFFCRCKRAAVDMTSRRHGMNFAQFYLYDPDDVGRTSSTGRSRAISWNISGFAARTGEFRIA